MPDQAAVVTLPFTVVPANRLRQRTTSGRDVGHFVFAGTRRRMDLRPSRGPARRRLLAPRGLRALALAFHLGFNPRDLPA